MGLIVMLGSVICLVGGIWMLVAAFSESVLWGLGSLFIPFVIVIFALTHLEVAKKPLLLWVSGFGLIVVGSVLKGMAGG